MPELADVISRLDTLNTSISAIEGRLKAVEDRKPADVTTLSVAAEDGKVTALHVGDLVKRLAGVETRLTAAQQAAENAERATLVARFAADGKAPLGEDGKPMSAEVLATFSVGELKRLLANTPATVPLTARGRVAGATQDSNLKGVARAAAALERQLQPA